MVLKLSAAQLAKGGLQARNGCGRVSMSLRSARPAISSEPRLALEPAQSSRPGGSNPAIQAAAGKERGAGVRYPLILATPASDQVILGACVPPGSMPIILRSAASPRPSRVVRQGSRAWAHPSPCSRRRSRDVQAVSVSTHDRARRDRWLFSAPNRRSKDPHFKMLSRLIHQPPEV